MSWIGLRDQSTCDFRAGGLGQAFKDARDPESLINKGSLLLEFVAVPGDHDQILMNYRSTYPTPSRIQLRLDLEGTLTFRYHRDGHEVVHALATGFVARSTSVTVRYTWDVKTDTGALSMDVEETGETHFTAFDGILAMTMRDAVRLFVDTTKSEFASDIKFAALADHVMPHGALPTLLPGTKVKTPHGQKTVGDLMVGDLLVTPDGRTAQVRWSGEVELPSRARFSPLRICAPFHNARGDIICSHDQQLRMTGNVVEYLFATDQVSACVGHLQYGIARAGSAKLQTVRYAQFILDTPAAVDIGGVLVEGMNIDQLRDQPEMKAHSLLSDLPAALFPTKSPAAPPLLHGYEAINLSNSQAA